jgi:hypothetical protein
MALNELSQIDDRDDHAAIIKEAGKIFRGVGYLLEFNDRRHFPYPVAPHGV